MRLFISPQGRIHFLWEPALTELAQQLGEPHVRRASWIDRSPDGYWADLERSGGPRLGPFESREAAIDAEKAWLENHRLGLAEPHATATI